MLTLPQQRCIKFLQKHNPNLQFGTNDINTPSYLFSIYNLDTRICLSDIYECWGGAVHIKLSGNQVVEYYHMYYDIHRPTTFQSIDVETGCKKNEFYKQTGALQTKYIDNVLKQVTVFPYMELYPTTIQTLPKDFKDALLKCNVTIKGIVAYARKPYGRIIEYEGIPSHGFDTI